MSREIWDRTQAQIIHSLGSVCAKYERIWSKFGEILVVTIYTLGSFLQYVQPGMGHEEEEGETEAEEEGK